MIVKMQACFSFFFFVLAISVSSGYSSPECEASKLCPTWHCLNPVGTCKCGNQFQDMIKCEPKRRVRLLIWQCMTYDNISSVTVAGSCPYSKLVDINEFYVQQPESVNELNNFTCGWLQRRGPLCSHCEDSLGVAVLSYSHECTRCLGNIYGWLLYFTLTLVPTTVFFFMVVFCRIHATAAHMNALICTVQLILHEFNIHPVISYDSDKNIYLIKVFQTITGIWNLDFFRYIYPPFCISIHYSTLQVLAFEYIIALYPLVLITTAYICIELYDKNYRVIVYMWKPFSWCLLSIRKCNVLNLNAAKYSIVNAFASFIILSYSKIFITCCNFFKSTQLYKVDGQIVYEDGMKYQYYLSYNASVPYFGPQHKPYFVTAIIIHTVFNIFPMLLLFMYPTRIFQKALGYFSRVRWHFLHTFMDSFQGHYKNGTNNTRDYRYFSGMYLLIRIIHFVPSIFDMKFRQKTNFLKFLAPYIFSVLFGVFRPYKKDIYNHVDCAFFGLLALSEFWLMSDVWIIKVPFIILYILCLIPCTYTLLLLTYYTLHLIIPQKLINSISTLK